VVCHLFFLRRHKCVIFVHAQTLYAVIAYDAKREQIKDLAALFRTNLGRRLYEDGFRAEVIKQFKDSATNVIYAPTASKRILGSINQMIFEFSYHFHTGGYGKEEALKDAEKRLPNSLYTKNGQYIKPLEELARSANALK